MILWDRYAEKQDGWDGCSRAHERCGIDGWARDVIGEIMEFIVKGRGVKFAGCKIGETNGLRDTIRSAISCKQQHEADYLRPFQSCHLGQRINDVVGLWPPQCLCHIWRLPLDVVWCMVENETAIGLVRTCQRSDLHLGLKTSLTFGKQSRSKTKAWSNCPCARGNNIQLPNHHGILPK
jgi:hypothetical protein